MSRSAMRVRRGILALTGVIAATAAVVCAQVPSIEPTPIDQATVQIVATLLEKGHLTKPTINDEISARWVKNYVKALDPRKYYFLKADVDEFHKYDTKLDDTIATGDLTFAKFAMDRFQKRAAERFEQAKEILKDKPDFTIEETLSSDPDEIDYPATDADAKERLRKQLKFDVLRKKVGSKISDEEALKQVTVENRDINRAIRQFDRNDLLERYLTALTTAIDPHSSYMGEKEFEDMFNQRLHLTLNGIGAQLLAIDGYPTVQEVVVGGAADKDGRLQADDKIIGMVNDDGSRESFVEQKLNNVVRKIRGKPGTKVKIVVIPADSKEEKIYELTRAKIDLNSEKAKGQIVELKTAEGAKPRKIGIVNVPSFYGNGGAVDGDPEAVSATRDVRKILEGFKADRVDAVVVDVRMDPGGLLDEAISLSGLFIDKGPIVQVREEHGVKHRDDEDEGTAWDGPLVVVIDKYCASASEIFAGAIKDYGRGLVVGDSSTFGKGSVQNVISINERLRLKNNSAIPNLGALKVTIQQFYLPDGDSTQIKGVTPHLHIPSVNDLFGEGEARYDTAMKFDKVAAVPHDRYNRVPADLLERITEKSEARRKASAKFQEEAKFITKAAERKKKHEITLNEKAFRDEIRADDKAEDAKPKAKGKKGSRKPDVVWDSEYYNNEILEIVNDYLTLGNRILLADPVKATANVAVPPPVRP
jgi:carboxyl-terminal processing protease